MKVVFLLILITFIAASFIKCSAILNDNESVLNRETDIDFSVEDKDTISSDINEPGLDASLVLPENTIKMNFIGPLTLEQIDINSNIQNILFAIIFLVKKLHAYPDSDLIKTFILSFSFRLIPELFNYTALILSKNDFEKSIYSRMGLNSGQISKIMMTENEKKLNLSQWIIGPLLWIIQIISFLPESNDIILSPIQFISSVQILLFMYLSEFILSKNKGDAQN